MKFNTKFLTRFVIVWALNSLLIFLANRYYPANFVLGSARVSVGMAAIFSGFLLTVICRVAKGFLRKFWSKKMGRYMMFLFYWAINSAGIWLVARIAPISGLGITAFYWAIVLGFATSLAQWAARQIFKAVSLL